MIRIKFLLVIFTITVEYWVKSADQIEKPTSNSSRSSDRCPKLTINPPPKDVLSFANASNAGKSKSNSSPSKRKTTSSNRSNSGEGRSYSTSTSGRQSEVINSDDRNRSLLEAKTPVPAKRSFRGSGSNANEGGSDQLNSPDSGRSVKFQKSNSFQARSSGLPPRNRKLRRNFSTISMESVDTSSPNAKKSNKSHDSPIYSPFSGYSPSAIRSPGGPYGGSSTTISASRSTTPGSAYEHSPAHHSPPVLPLTHLGSSPPNKTIGIPRSKIHLSKSPQRGNTDLYYSPGSSSTDVKVVSSLFFGNSPVTSQFTDDPTSTVYPKSTPPGSSIYRRTPVDTSSPGQSPGDRDEAAILNSQLYRLVLEDHIAKYNARARAAGSESSVNKATTSSGSYISHFGSVFGSGKATNLTSLDSQTLPRSPNSKEIKSKEFKASPRNSENEIRRETSKETNTTYSVGSPKSNYDATNSKEGKTGGSPRGQSPRNHRETANSTENGTKSKGSPKYKQGTNPRE